MKKKTLVINTEEEQFVLLLFSTQRQFIWRNSFRYIWNVFM